MSKVFVGKFADYKQIEGDYYLHGGVENEDVYKKHFGGLDIGDYVIPVSQGIEKLYRVNKIERNHKTVKVLFDVVKTFAPRLRLTYTICCCKYFDVNLDLINKAVKQTKKVGFIEIQVNADIDCANIDFSADENIRHFYIVKNANKDLIKYKERDIVVVEENGEILDIQEYKNGVLARYDVLWSLYSEKTKMEKNSLNELMEYAIKNNNKSKKSYLKKVISALDDDQSFVVDSPVALYDNILVGKAASKGIKVVNKKEGDLILEDENEEDEDTTAYNKYVDLLEFNPNLILHGVPGTGKTYSIKKIIQGFEKRNDINMSYNKAVEENRVKFVTFHQSLSYEEFIEGIRPITNDSGNIEYKIEEGVFRRVVEDCNLSSTKELKKDEALEFTNQDSNVWKVSLGMRTTEESIYKSLVAKNQIAIGFGDDKDITDWSDAKIAEIDTKNMLKYLHSDMQIGDIVFVFDSIKTIRRIGVVTSDYKFVKDEVKYTQRRDVKWLLDCEKTPIDIFELNGNKRLTLSSLYELKINISDALNLIQNKGETIDTKVKPYYMVIDEINRGNVAKIFGELITLLEKDKRDKMSCVLPYSKKKFMIPENVYLIGTMNTSDRSIALLDTALRRRFVFAEIAPNLDVVKPKVGEFIDLRLLLQDINRKLEKALDREHRIGHSYFVEENMTDIKDMFFVWYYNIMPLFMEYFYGNVEEIKKLVGNSFFDENNEVKELSIKKSGNEISEFEAAIVKIYKGGVEA